jgi:hypothetical protein
MYPGADELSIQNLRLERPYRGLYLYQSTGVVENVKIVDPYYGVYSYNSTSTLRNVEIDGGTYGSRARR